MEELFLRFLNVSINAGWLVLAVLLIRFIFRKAPRWIVCLLWALVGIRLLMPFSIESVFSLIPSAETVPQEILLESQPQIYSGIPYINNTVNPVISDSFAPNPGDSANPLQIYSFIASWIWLLGLAAMVIYAAASWIMLKLRVRTATRMRDNIFQCETVDSPFVLGFIRPRIYMPYNISDDESRYVIAHEQAHLHRGDHLIKPLSFLLLSVYWFNPLLWAAYILLCRDIELACDERVIGSFDESERRGYSSALLDQSISRRRIAACPLAFGEVGVKERIKSVMNYRKPAFWVVIAALAVCAVTAVCFLTDPAGIKLTQLDDSGDYSHLTDGITYIEVFSGVTFEIVSDSDIGEVLDFVGDIRIYRAPLSKSRDEERDSWNKIVLKSYDGVLSYTVICISYDYRELWIANGVKPSYSYRVVDPEAMRSFFDRYFAKDEENADSDYEQEWQTLSDDVTWNWVQMWYSLNAALKLSEDAINKSSFTFGGAPHTPVIRISSVEELEAFRQRYGRDLDLSSESGGVSFDGLTSRCNDSFFDERTLIVAAVIYPSDGIAWKLSGISNTDGCLRLLVSPETEDMGWRKTVISFVVVEVGNEYIEHCNRFDAQTGDEWVTSVCYEYHDSPDWGTPTLYLNSDGTATFIYSMLSSYIGWGSYSVDGDYLTMKTDDGMYEYTFRIVDDDKLTFVEDMSSPLPEYAYSAGAQPQSSVPDGAEFEKKDK